MQRREFLAGVGIAAATAMLPALAKAEEKKHWVLFVNWTNGTSTARILPDKNDYLVWRLDFKEAKFPTETKSFARVVKMTDSDIERIKALSICYGKDHREMHLISRKHPKASENVRQRMIDYGYDPDNPTKGFYNETA
jgi:hypothetical protein